MRRLLLVLVHLGVCLATASAAAVAAPAATRFRMQLKCSATGLGNANVAAPGDRWRCELVTLDDATRKPVAAQAVRFSLRTTRPVRRKALPSRRANASTWFTSFRWPDAAERRRYFVVAVVDVRGVTGAVKLPVDVRRRPPDPPAPRRS